MSVVLPGLKNIQCGDSGETEIMQTKNVFFNYLNASPNDRFLNDDWLERLSEFRQNRSQCSIIPTDEDCKMYDLSPSQSYGILKEMGESKTAFINIFPSGISILNI